MDKETVLTRIQEAGIVAVVRAETSAMVQPAASINNIFFMVLLV